MKIIETPIEDLIIIEPRVFKDDRGYFMETFRDTQMDETRFPYPFVQDNEAMSNRGVLRGLHYQVGEKAQAKLVRVISGAVYDVAVDLRTESPTYGKSYGILLSGENKKQFYIPRGFAHGYLVLEDETIFSYKCDNYYAPDAEGGLRYDDPTLKIEWKGIDDRLQLSEKDLLWPEFGNHRKI